MRRLGLIAIVFATALHAEPPSPDPQARALLKELVETDTSGDIGTTGLVGKIAARFRAAGWPAADVTVIAPPEHPDKANIVVRLRGTGTAKPVLWIGHLDVVAAKPEDWSLPPFKLTEKGGYFYGRGTLDMKGDAAAAIDALLTLRAEGWKPGRDILLALTADEESGDGNGVDFLTAKHRALIDAATVVNLDAGGGALKDGKPLFYGVETSEKIYVTYRAEATSPGGHSSRPTADNPIYRLAHALVRLEALKFPARMTDTVKLYLERSAQFQDAATAADMRAVAAGDKAAIDRLSRKVEYNIILHTTCVPTMGEAGHAENALPQRARATIQCRVLPGETDASVKAALTAAIADPSIVLTEIAPFVPSPESAPTPALLSTVAQVAGTIWPAMVVVPVLEAGASDGLYTRNVGIPTYGIGGMSVDIDDIRAHGRDERVRVASFDRAVLFNYRLMKAMGTK